MSIGDLFELLIGASILYQAWLLYIIRGEDNEV